MGLMLRLGLGGGASISAVHKAVLASRSLAAKPHAGETQYVLYFSDFNNVTGTTSNQHVSASFFGAPGRDENSWGRQGENDFIDGIANRPSTASWRLHVTRKEMWQ
jgi:hypothetical protein